MRLIDGMSVLALMLVVMAMFTWGSVVGDTERDESEAKYRHGKKEKKDGNLPAGPEYAVRAVIQGVRQAIAVARLPGDITHGSRQEGTEFCMLPNVVLCGCIEVSSTGENGRRSATEESKQSKAKQNETLR